MTSAHKFRLEVRSGQHSGHTAGFAPGYLQVNLVILPAWLAAYFEQYCRKNPTPCPLISMTEPGDRSWPALGADLDIATDVPAYNIYKNGVLLETRTELAETWSDDFVSFAIGCSFTFEHALMRAGFGIRNIEMDTTVPMYRTNIETESAGPFDGPLVVSMRPLPQDRLEEVHAITAKYPWAHGAPVHVGDPSEIGISAVEKPDWGQRSEIKSGEVPVFWACGVTPQAALERAKLDLCITHRPGHMLVTDLPEDAPFPEMRFQ